MPHASSDNLRKYREKRSADQTTEPFGAGAVTTGRTFVVQKHSARQLHYDFRIEFDGVLKSWAVPRGPSFDPADKRLAVMTEDHPIEYADFEGIIPEGNYGAGAVIVWDQGVWVPKIPFDEGIEKGKLLFDLFGHKLHGTWTLVKIKKSEKEWLLIKETDAYSTSDGEQPFTDESVFSGLLVDELKAHKDIQGPIRTDLEEAGAEPGVLLARDVDLMKAQVREDAFTDPDWLFELKYDGYRLLCSREGTQPLLRSRAGHDITATFPEIAKAIAKLPFENFVIDGEVVVHDESGLPSFQRLQKRGRMNNRVEIARATVEYPASLYAFDLLALEGFDIRTLPLEQRKDFLRRILPPVGTLRYSDHIVEKGEAFYAQVDQMRLEGMVAKRRSSRYVGGRSAEWLKIRLDRTEDFVVVGFSEPKGSRSGIGSLHLAQYDGDDLIYAGAVGTGFSSKDLDDWRERLDPTVVNEPLCIGVIPTSDKHHWVKPEFVVEVRYKEWVAGHLLRHPVFERLRDDKPIEDCVKAGGEPVVGSPEPISDDSPRPLVPFTNLDKVFWPEEGYTKGDLIEYYRSVAQWLLPFLEDRPLVMTRFPDGIAGKSFFQKDAPDWSPEWMRRESIWSDEKENKYFVCEDVESLLYVINMGTIPLHIWSSRVAHLEAPDWTIMDLDPKEAPFSMVIDVALGVKALCDEVGLPCYAKTSGSTGMHVLVPLGQQTTYEQSKGFSELLARVAVARLPDAATVTRSLTGRDGKVYIDFVQNGYGKLLVSPLCVRPLPGAPVSMPLPWDQVTPDLKLEDYTIRTAPDVLRSYDEHPLLPVLTDRPKLGEVLGALGELVEE